MDISDLLVTVGIPGHSLRQQSPGLPSRGDTHVLDLFELEASHLEIQHRYRARHLQDVCTLPLSSSPR